LNPSIWPLLDNVFKQLTTTNCHISKFGQVQTIHIQRNLFMFSNSLFKVTSLICMAKLCKHKIFHKTFGTCSPCETTLKYVSSNMVITLAKCVEQKF
jgi:cbb3-type cytochrome oxidase subunit 1